MSIICVSYARFFTTAGVGGPGTCSLTQWSDWGRCNVQCGGEGRQVRTRRIRNIDDSRDSVECVEDLTQVQPCNNGPCPGIAK